MTKKEIKDVLVHELWLQNLSHFGTLEWNVYERDAEYMLGNLVRAGVIELKEGDSG